MILAIEREWGQYPGWFDTLDRETRIRLLADWRVRSKPKKPGGSFRIGNG